MEMCKSGSRRGWYKHTAAMWQGDTSLLHYNTSDTRGNSPSYGTSYQKTGHDVPYLFVKSSVALNLS